jgi:hypothetical protein
VTRDETKLVLDVAHRWLDGRGAALPGAAVAQRAIGSLIPPFDAGAFDAPEDEQGLIDMIVWEGQLHRDPAISEKRYTRLLLEAVDAAVAAAVRIVISS